MHCGLQRGLLRPATRYVLRQHLPLPGGNFISLRTIHQSRIVLPSLTKPTILSRGFHVSAVCRQRDPYDVLGISRDASEQDIKKAYRKLALKHHPDQNQDDPKAKEKFAEVNDAYQMLKDPDSRRQYDTFGHAGDGGGFGGFGGGQGFQGGGFDPNDIFSQFEDLFRQGQRQQTRRSTGPEAGRDEMVTVKISFMEAMEGTQKKIQVPLIEECAHCLGSGARPGTSPTTCNQCGGRGMEFRRQGMFTVQSECYTCGGTGQKIEHKCGVCGGNGAVRNTKEVDVDIPQGVNERVTLRVPGSGSAGRRGGPRGNLLVKVAITKHKTFVRKGDNIHTEIKIPFTTAILGGPIEVDTVVGTFQLEVASGTQSESVMTVRGKGAPRLQSRSRGDHIVTLRVDIPRKSTLSARQKELLEEFRATTGAKAADAKTKDDKNVKEEKEEQSGKKKGFFAKVKETLCEDEDADKKK